MLASDPPNDYSSAQGCQTPSLLVKHDTRRWNLKKCAKRVFFKADFAVFWAQKEVAEALNWMQNTLDTDQRCLFII